MRPDARVVVGASVVVDANVVSVGVVVDPAGNELVVVLADAEQEATISDTDNSAVFHRARLTRRVLTIRMLTLCG